MAEEYIPSEIAEIPAAIRATVDQTREPVELAAHQMRARQPRRIYLIGNGTSLYSSLAAAYTGRLLAGSEDPITLAWAAGDFRYYPPAISSEDIVIGVTASGEFRDVLAVFEQQAGNCLRVGITHVPGSSVTRLADVVIYSGGGLSRVPVMTKTYVSTLSAAHALLLAFYGAGQEQFAALRKSADYAEEALDQAGQKIPGWVKAFKDFSHAIYFGNGASYPAALEAALKMKEMALLHAEGNESWEVASGAATLIGLQTLCVGLDSGGAGQAGTLDLVRQVMGWKAPALLIGPKAVEGAEYLPVKLPALESFSSLVLVPPAALFAYRLARARGLDPDRPSWRDRYLSQGMNHIIEE
jgi:glutamine---fructose-6-phosphate transaminase (isomerizing)